MVLNDLATQMRISLLFASTSFVLLHILARVQAKMFSVSVGAVIKAYLLPLISLIYHDAKAPQAAPKPTRAQPKFWMPSFRSPHTFPTEIILKFAEFLDEASFLALRHTNRALFYTISLT